MHDSHNEMKDKNRPKNPPKSGMIFKERLINSIIRNGVKMKPIKQRSGAATGKYDSQSRSEGYKAQRNTYLLAIKVGFRRISS